MDGDGSSGVSGLEIGPELTGDGVFGSVDGSRETDTGVSGSVVVSREDANAFGLGLSAGGVVFGIEKNRYMAELVKNGRDEVMQM